MNIIEKKLFKQIHFQTIDSKINSIDGISYTDSYSLILLITYKLSVKGIHILKSDEEYYNIKEDNDILRKSLLESYFSVDKDSMNFIHLNGSNLSILHMMPNLCKLDSAKLEPYENDEKLISTLWSHRVNELLEKQLESMSDTNEYTSLVKALIGIIIFFLIIILMLFYFLIKCFKSYQQMEHIETDHPETKVVKVRILKEDENKYQNELWSICMISLYPKDKNDRLNQEDANKEKFNYQNTPKNKSGLQQENTFEWMNSNLYRDDESIQTEWIKEDLQNNRTNKTKKINEVVELANCKHYYHKECIEKWLAKSSSCPLCRIDAC